MMTVSHVLSRATAIFATIVALVLLARASAAPLPYHDDGMAQLRLSWSARPERIETCRALSEEELKREEEHMRQRVECDGRFATYALRVESDDKLLSASVVRGAGLRHDRPIYLLRDLEVPSGVHHIRVSFTRRERRDDRATAANPAAPVEQDTGLFAGRAEREAVERVRRARAAIPERLVLDTTVVFAPGRVMLVTFDTDRRSLEVLDRN
jgi:hypothetical protein